MGIKHKPVFKTDFLDLYQCDCVEIMRQFSDKHFDLAIVDPPYGLSMSGGQIGGAKKKYKHFAGGDDSIPDAEYFTELFRISKNWIIWGGNYMTAHLPPTSCYIVWDKCIIEDFTFAMCELAWTSFNMPAKIFRKKAYGRNTAIDRIHPTQKPIELYEWLLVKFASNGHKILDTHFGSGSIAIAVNKLNKINKMNLHLTAAELDEYYTNASIERIKRHISQLTINFDSYENPS